MLFSCFAAGSVSCLRPLMVIVLSRFLLNKMPQFDVSTFFNQLFWLSLFFCGFYLAIVGFVLPDLVSSLKSRKKKEKNELLLSLKAFLSSNKAGLLAKPDARALVAETGRVLPVSW